jgi:hypothetical protein
MVYKGTIGARLYKPDTPIWYGDPPAAALDAGTTYAAIKN